MLGLMQYLTDLSIHVVGNGKIFPRVMETKTANAAELGERSKYLHKQ